jgi:hypothetical protein
MLQDHLNWQDQMEVYLLLYRVGWNTGFVPELYS